MPGACYRCPYAAVGHLPLIFVCLLTHEPEFTHSWVARYDRNGNEEMSVSHGKVMGTQPFPHAPQPWDVWDIL